METDNNESGTFCPIIKDECMGRKCKLYIKMLGKHPQTGNPIDHWDCTLNWITIIGTENNQKINELGASIDSMRNEMVKGQRHFNNILEAASKKRLKNEN